MSENTPAPVGPGDVEAHIVQKWFDADAEKGADDADGEKPLRSV